MTRTFLVVTFSCNQIQADAKLIQQEKKASTVQLNKFYLYNKAEIQTPNIQQTNQIFNINSATPICSTQNIMLSVTRNSNSQLTSKLNHNFISDNTVQVHFDQSKSSLATQMHHHSNLTSFNHRNSDDQHATHVRSTQNISTLARQKPNSNFIPFICTNLDSQPATRVYLTQNNSNQNNSTHSPSKSLIKILSLLFVQISIVNMHRGYA